MIVPFPLWPRRSSCGLALLVCALVLLLAGEGRGFESVIDSPMYRDPLLPMPVGKPFFPKEALALWLRALERPESDLKCQAAQAIAQAHRDGNKGFKAAIPTLQKVLEAPDQHPAVLLTAAEALIVLDARSAAGALFRTARAGTNDLREVVEPALARWDYRPARADWLARIEDTATAQRSLVRAIAALGMVREDKAVDRLRVLLLDGRTAGPVRLEAARALAMIRTVGLEKDAERLASDTSSRSLARRLAGAALLRHHSGGAAVQLLQRLMHDPEPTVAIMATARLLEIDTDRVVPVVRELASREDPTLRLYAVEVVRRRPSEDRIRLLGERLNDDDLAVRVEARDALRELADEKGWRKAVIEAASAPLRADAWRGQEQATVLLTQLDHKPAAPRLVELLKSGRLEVVVTAAWGLCMLNVADTLPDVTEHLRRRQAWLASIDLRINPDADLAAQVEAHALSQLCQLVGRQKYRLADSVLRGFIPRSGGTGLFAEARAAAIWALGKIHEDQAEKKLTAALEARLKDTRTIPPEDFRVRLMSAIALGRMGAKEALPSLRESRRSDTVSFDAVTNACGWAIERMTGEPMHPAPSFFQARRQWFLLPVK